MQWSATTRNRFRDAFVAAFPVGAVLVIRTGAPAGVGSAAGGTALASVILPATPFTSTTGVATLAGVWSDPADAAGTAGHYRMTNGSDIEEGTITATGGGGDMEIDNTNIALNQVVTITAFTKTVAGA